MSNVTRLDERRDADYFIKELKEKLNAKDIIIATVNEDGTFGTLVDVGIVDIDFCYIIDCLKARRRMRLEE